MESPEPEVLSGEGEQVLDILKIINHPDYQPNQDPGVGGPLEGNDISVYIVDDSQFKMGKNTQYDTFSYFLHSIQFHKSLFIV